MNPFEQTTQEQRLTKAKQEFRNLLIRRAVKQSERRFVEFVHSAFGESVRRPVGGGAA